MKIVPGYMEAIEMAYARLIHEYGMGKPEWRIMRLKSVIDQIVQRLNLLKKLLEYSNGKIVAENNAIRSQLFGLINYSVIAWTQINYGESSKLDIDAEQAKTWYDSAIDSAHKELFENNDHLTVAEGLSVKSFASLIEALVHKIKQAYDRDTIVDSLEHIINYSVYALITIEPVPEIKQDTNE